MRSRRMAACAAVAAGLATAALGQGAAADQLIDAATNAVLNAKLEYPYLNPEHSDAFHGKLPRLYLHGLWKLMILPDGETNRVGRDEYRFVDGGVERGFCGRDFDDSGWQDFYVPQKITIGKENPFGIRLEPTTAKPPHDRFMADGYSYLATRFVVPAAQRGRRVVLYLEAANNLPVIYVNGGEAARPPNQLLAGNADAHWLDITPWIEPAGTNRLVVRTYSIFDADANGPVRGMNHNGIWKPVWLEFWPALRVERMRITPRWPDHIDVELRLANAGAARRAKLRLAVEPWTGRHSRVVDERAQPWTQELGEVALTAGTNTWRGTMALPGIRPWHMEQPYLYSLKVLADGELAGWDTFGMRSVGRDGRRMLINGQSAYFFGIGLSDGAELFELQRRQDGYTSVMMNKNGFLARLLEFYRRDMNVNALIRDGFQPPIFYRLCDELGLARPVDEPILYGGGNAPEGENRVRNPWLLWRFNRYSEADEARWRAYYERIAELRWNHPSLLAWGTTCEQAGMRRCNESMLRIVQGLGDDSRLKYLEGVHFANKANDAGVPGWHEWAPGDGIKGFDFACIHNRPLQYEKALPFGRVIEELRFWEERSRTAYSFEGGIPMLASPALVMNNAAQPTTNLTSAAGYDKARLVEYLTDKNQQRWYGYYLLFIALFGADNYLANGEPKQQMLGFEQQRLGETFRLNNAFFRGWGAVTTPSFLDGRRLIWGKVLDPEAIRPGVLAGYMKQLQQRVLPLLDWHLKHNLFAGEKTPFTLYVLNDAVEPFPGGEVAIRLVPGSAFDNFGKTRDLPDACRISVSVGSVSVGERFETPIELAVPAGLVPGRYTVELVLTARGREVARNTYPFFVGRREAAPIRSALRVALYEPVGAQPAGGVAVARILRENGVAHTPIQNFERLAEHQALIVAPGGLDAKLTESGDAIHRWILEGGRVLCLEQKHKGPYPFLTQARLVSSAGLHAAEPVVPEHPVFAGIERVKDWDCLNGGDGAVYGNVIEPLSESVLLLGAVTRGGDEHVTPQGGMRFAMALSESREGKGLCLLSQVTAVSRCATDPVARQYVRQLLGYTLSAGAGKYAQPIRGQYEPPRVERGLEPDLVFFVDLSKHCNRAFADELASDGQGGWDDGGPQNDMRALEPGVQTLAGVPFRILDPASNGARSCVVLGGGYLKLPEAVRGIPIGAKARALHFLHAHGHGGDAVEPFAKYVVRYEDGTTADIPLITGKNTGCWWGEKPIADGVVAWTGANPLAGAICLYACRWANPHPEKAIAALDFATLAAGKAVPILVAVTGEHS